MLHRHNQTELERQVLRSSFDVRVLTQAQTAYAAASSVLCGVLALGKRGIPLTLIEPFVALSQLFRHCKRYADGVVSSILP
jgi:hypothetical protein